ncbi:C39 family peptidase [Tahibacter amnicola]|uniref:C39 family peptidase n=1 Tax=Tahibacter amnicola TaxID=2976241 RepID=A0ABY6BJI1_9GAMM|nr:C39 family peptidase [Tahibacter amnicola]UXI70163.1 C39 family peptidase [Tahibacter amnicola]
MKPVIRNLLAVALVAAAADAAAGDGHRYIPVNLVTQEHSNWCWAGVAVSVLNRYNQSPSQCSVVNWAFGISHACGNSTFNWNNYANSPNGIYGGGGSIQGILNHWGVRSYGIQNYLRWSTVVTEVNANRPFVMRYGWTGGGGHFIVGYGYNDTSGTQRVAYMNPWPGEGYTWVNYQWAVRASDHAWTHTLRMN